MNQKNSKSTIMKILSLQKLFLKDIIKKIIDVEFVEFVQQIQHYPSLCTLDIFLYWSVIIKDATFESIYPNYENCTCSQSFKCDGCNENYALPELYILIKPEINDDYLTVLREMKMQIEINNLSLQQGKKAFLLENATVPGLKEYISRDTYAFKANYVLFIDEYKLSKLPKQEFVDIFKYNGISIIFKNALF